MLATPPLSPRLCGVSIPESSHDSRGGSLVQEFDLAIDDIDDDSEFEDLILQGQVVGSCFSSLAVLRILFVE